MWAFHFKTEVWAYARVSPFNPWMIEKSFFLIKWINICFRPYDGIHETITYPWETESRWDEVEEESIPKHKQDRAVTSRSRSKAAQSPEVVSTLEQQVKKQIKPKGETWDVKRNKQEITVWIKTNIEI